jgi:hypothetical protein
MTPKPIFRFTIGRLLVVTAILAVLLAGAFSNPFQSGGVAGLLNPRYLINRAIALSLIVVCFLNLSLSPYIRLMVGGLVATFVADLLSMFSISLLNSGISRTSVLIPMGFFQVLRESSYLVFIWGLFRTFQDLKERLIVAEARSSKRVVDAKPDPWAPPDAS